MTISKLNAFTSAPKRLRAQVEPKLEQKLLAYASVAAAAGVAIVATSPTAEAKIVYTPVNVEIVGGYSIDLNGDGVIDFNLVNGGAASVGGSLQIQYLDVCHIPWMNFSHQCVSSSSQLQPNASNLVRTTEAGGAAVLPFGAEIGPGQQWGGQGHAENMVDRVFYVPGTYHPQKWLGAWANGGKGITNKYLGLKFKIGDAFHYGWARVSVTIEANGYSATITGYAYETTPGAAIRAGYTSSSEEISELQSKDFLEQTQPQETSLGVLALGSSGLSLWRKEPN
jgi:hypothetical protein